MSSLVVAKLCRWFGVPRGTVCYKPVKSAAKVDPKFSAPTKAMIEESRYQPTIWNSQIQIAFLHAPAGLQPHQIRTDIHARLVQVRALRNRIAHYEPIFQRNLHGDLSRIEDIVSYRCAHTIDWLRQSQMVRFMLGHRPI
ncbi:hypothetical protein [Achromobacter marplatensis]|uniref:hypothetical protein n=1 Tax=Achromobacter marplatensis TaxID=470868 RepID=UPI001303D61A|nr:hypothetical protein [Achromobacter marplatensis]